MSDASASHVARGMGSKNKVDLTSYTTINVIGNNTSSYDTTAGVFLSQKTLGNGNYAVSAYLAIPKNTANMTKFSTALNKTANNGYYAGWALDLRVQTLQAVWLS